jgi:TatA/E family protein of Tat protein translocase
MLVDFIKNISPTEIAIITLILVVFFGSKLVTNLARSVGQTVKEVKKVGKSFTEALESDETQKGEKGEPK